MKPPKLLLLLITASLLAQPAHSDPDLEACTENGKIMSPMVEFQSPDGKKSILLVGMTHAGAPLTYSRLNQALNSYINNGPKPVVISKEFHTCTQNVMLYQDAKIEPRQIEKLAEEPQVYDLGLEKLSQVLGAENLAAKSGCIKDETGTLRPEYVIQINKRGCAVYHKEGNLCQLQDWKIPSGPGIIPVEADLVLNEASAGTQWLVSRTHVLAGRDDRNDESEAETTLNRQARKMSLQKRNQNAIDHTIKSLGEAERAIVPWGTHHLTGMAELLVKNGFKKVRSERFVFFDSSEVRRPGSLKNYYKLQMEKRESCQKAARPLPVPGPSGPAPIQATR